MCHNNPCEMHFDLSGKEHRPVSGIEESAFTLGYLRKSGKQVRIPVRQLSPLDTFTGKRMKGKDQVREIESGENGQAEKFSPEKEEREKDGGEKVF
jgi:hypothetical protein